MSATRPPGPNVKPAKLVGSPESTAVSQIDRATEHVRQARAEVEKLKGQYSPDSAAWAQCDTIDNRLFEALAALGE